MDPREKEQTHEIKLKHQKSIDLATEFQLKIPTQETWREAQDAIAKGLPFDKSIKLETLLHLFETGQVMPEAIRKGSGNAVVYAAVILDKGYGAFAVILKPEVMNRDDYAAYPLDNDSTYVNQKMTSGRKSREEVMRDYTMTPAEFREFYAFCIASLADHKDEYSYKQMEELIRFITFDIGLPAIRLEDIERIVYKVGWGGTEIELEPLVAKAAQAGIRLEELPREANELYWQENEIGEQNADRVNFPRKFRDLVG